MRRLGKFYMTEQFMRSDAAQEIFGIMAFVPYRVEALAYNFQFECIGVSHLFEPLEEGLKVPEYKIEITEHDDPEIDELIVTATVI